LIRRLFTLGAAALVGAVLAVATLVGVGLLVLHSLDGSSEYCRDSVRTQLTIIAQGVEAPVGSRPGPAGQPFCLDSQDGARTERWFAVNDRRETTAVLNAIKSQLKADGWLRRPSQDLDIELTYAHEFDGKKYWAEIDVGRRQVWLGLSAGASV
jgi:hypothetical protein